MAYEDKKVRFEIEGVVRIQDHNKADLIAPGAAFAVTVPVPREEQVDLLTLFNKASAPDLREIFSAITYPYDSVALNELLIEPKNVIAIMHQGQGGILNSKNPNFHAHVFDRTKALDHIVSKRTFVPNPSDKNSEKIDFFASTKSDYNLTGFTDLDFSASESAEAKEHRVLAFKGQLSEFFINASNPEIEMFRGHMISAIEKTGENSNGQVRIIIENDRYISFLSGENLAQEGNKRWFEDVNVSPT